MARIFITGSADGLGQLAAKDLIAQGHQVVLHARNKERARDALKNVPNAEDVLTGDLSNMGETIQLAEKANASGQFDAIIHNAGVYRIQGNIIFAVNTLAPYILTSQIERPGRLIYLSSGMHTGGNVRNLDSDFEKGSTSYSDSKLHVVILTMAVSRKWRNVYCNAVDPGWVPTRMGGTGAPDNLQKGFETQSWLAVSNDTGAKTSGHYFHHKKEVHYLSVANDEAVQEKFLGLCKKLTGVNFPIHML